MLNIRSTIVLMWGSICWPNVEQIFENDQLENYGQFHLQKLVGTTTKIMIDIFEKIVIRSTCVDQVLTKCGKMKN